MSKEILEGIKLLENFLRQQVAQFGKATAGHVLFRAFDPEPG